MMNNSDLKSYDFDYDKNDWTFNENPYYSPEKCGLIAVRNAVTQ